MGLLNNKIVCFTVILTPFISTTTSFPSLLRASNSPSITKGTTCSGMLSKQWAAVTTHFLLIRDPPQKIPLVKFPFLNLKLTCQGNSSGLATDPPTIRGFFPIPQLTFSSFPSCVIPPPAAQIVSSSSDAPPVPVFPPVMVKWVSLKTTRAV